MPCSAWQAEVLHQHSPRLLLLLAKLFQTLAPLSLAQWKGAACFTLEARRCQLPPRRLPTLWLQRLCLHHSLRGSLVEVGIIRQPLLLLPCPIARSRLAPAAWPSG